MIARREKVQSSQASIHDARFLAVLDSLNYDGALHPDRYTEARRLYWAERLESSSGDVFVAREGGLYIGYLALHESTDNPIAEVVVNPRQAEARLDIVNALVQKAGVTLEALTLTTDAQLIAS